MTFWFVVIKLQTSWRKKIESAVNASIIQTELIQSVWSDYGKLLRIHFDKPDQPAFVVKAIKPPDEQNHPRGWQSTFAHQRKLKSYQVEAYWYELYASETREYVAVPKPFLVHQDADGCLLVLEDLDAQYPQRLTSPFNKQACLAALEWLAQFHAFHLGHSGEGLWDTGCYWHLDTRPDEWSAMNECLLKTQATAIDRELSDCELSTLVHGDAKAANFCVSEDGQSVAAVDFQYIGRGCGIRDVAYFLGSCLNDDGLYEQSDMLLDHYFTVFRSAVESSYESSRLQSLEQRWRDLYPFAWADFQRFMLGWAPEHVKLNDYSNEQTDIALQFIG